MKSWVVVVGVMLTTAGCAGSGSSSLDALTGQDARDTDDTPRPKDLGQKDPGPEDTAGGDSMLVDVPLDRRTPDDILDRDAKPVDVPPDCTVTFVKYPWFVNPSSSGFQMQAETFEDCPMMVDVQWEGGSATLLSEPTRPLVEVLGFPMDELEGAMHSLHVTFPAGTEQVSVSVRNTTEFSTVLNIPANLSSFRMVIFGDTRTNADKHSMVANGIALHSPDVLLNSGDLVASGGVPDQWQVFFNIEREILTQSFFLPVMGNHELMGEGYFDIFFDASNAMEGKPRNYWVDLGLVGVVVIERYATSWAKAEPLAWLEDALERLSHKPWLILSYHEPAYTFSKHGPWDYGREHIHPLVLKYGVDLVVSGHNHCYEHYRVDGVDYVVTGGGGAPLYAVKPEKGSPEEIKWFVAGASIHHFLVADVTAEAFAVSVVKAEDLSVYEEFQLSDR